MRHKNLSPHQNFGIKIAVLYAGHLSPGYPPFAHSSCWQWGHFGCHVGQRREQAPREQSFHCISENESRATFLSKVIWNYLIVVIIWIASGVRVEDITKLKRFQPPQHIISVKVLGSHQIPFRLYLIFQWLSISKSFFLSFVSLITYAFFVYSWRELSNCHLYSSVSSFSPCFQGPPTVPRALLHRHALHITCHCSMYLPWCSNFMFCSEEMGGGIKIWLREI